MHSRVSMHTSDACAFRWFTIVQKVTAVALISTDRPLKSLCFTAGQALILSRALVRTVSSTLGSNELRFTTARSTLWRAGSASAGLQVSTHHRLANKPLVGVELGCTIVIKVLILLTLKDCTLDETSQGLSDVTMTPRHSQYLDCSSKQSL